MLWLCSQRRRATGSTAIGPASARLAAADDRGFPSRILPDRPRRGDAGADDLGHRRTRPGRGRSGLRAQLAGGARDGAAGVDIVVLGGVPINLSRGYDNAQAMIRALEAERRSRSDQPVGAGEGRPDAGLPEGGHRAAYDASQNARQSGYAERFGCEVLGAAGWGSTIPRFGQIPAHAALTMGRALVRQYPQADSILFPSPQLADACDRGDRARARGQRDDRAAGRRCGTRCGGSALTTGSRGLAACCERPERSLQARSAMSISATYSSASDHQHHHRAAAAAPASSTPSLDFDALPSTTAAVISARRGTPADDGGRFGILARGRNHQDMIGGVDLVDQILGAAGQVAEPAVHGEGPGSGAACRQMPTWGEGRAVPARLGELFDHLLARRIERDDLDRPRLGVRCVDAEFGSAVEAMRADSLSIIRSRSNPAWLRNW